MTHSKIPHLQTFIADGVKAIVMDVTPDDAMKILRDHNRSNRPIKPTVVKKYVRLMQSGDWRFSPETISVSKTGRLLNGQHRLSAVELSGVTCRFLFAFGFDDDVFSVLDRGAARTMSDALGTDRRMTEVAALLARMAMTQGQSLVTDADVYRATLAVSDMHNHLINYCPTHARFFSSAGFRLGCIARMISDGETSYCMDLYKSLVLGHTENLPMVGHAVVRGVMTGRIQTGGGTHQLIGACIAWDVFDKRMASRSRISLTYRPEVSREIVSATGYVVASMMD